MEPVIQVAGLAKSFGATKAADGVSFCVEHGKVFTLLGPNGAGKTTIIEILEGYSTRDSGDVSVLGFDPEIGGRDLRNRIGIMLQQNALEPQLTVREVLTLHQDFYPRPKPVAELISKFGLADKTEARIRTLSGGQKRRLDLALALIGDPDLLFLDEPTGGFDPEARQLAWEIISDYKVGGKSVVLTTHDMEEAERLSDRLAILVGGRIVAEGSISALRQKATAKVLIAFSLPEGLSTGDMPVELGGKFRQVNGRTEIRSETPTATLSALAGWATAQGVELIDLEVRRPNLTDLYLSLVRAEDKSGTPVER